MIPSIHRNYCSLFLYHQSWLLSYHNCSIFPPTPIFLLLHFLFDASFELSCTDTLPFIYYFRLSSCHISALVSAFWVVYFFVAFAAAFLCFGLNVHTPASFTFLFKKHSPKNGILWILKERYVKKKRILFLPFCFKIFVFGFQSLQKDVFTNKHHWKTCKLPETQRILTSEITKLIYEKAFWLFFALFFVPSKKWKTLISSLKILF